MSGIIGKNANRSSGVIGTAAAGIASLAADSSPQLGGFLDAAGNYIQMEKGGDISSASPTVIDTDGDYFLVTGTTNFSAFTVAADRHFFLEFGGALTMTHGNGTLDLPGGANITTAASDVGEFVSTAANVVTCVNYTKRDGTAVVLADNSITLAKMAGGTDGQIITYDASGDPVAVGPGSDGEVLTSTGAGSPPAFESVSASSGMWKFLSTQNASTSSTIDFFSLATSTYSKFMIHFHSVYISANAVIQVRIREAGGSSIITSGTYYGWMSGGTHAGAETSAYGLSSFALSGSLIANGSIPISGYFESQDIGATSGKRVGYLSRIQAHNASGYSGYYDSGGASSDGDNDGYDGIQFLLSTGSYSSGTFSLYGLLEA